MTTDLTLAERIERDRRERDWNQNELARRLGITQGAVSKWETGKGYPSPRLLRALGDELGWDEQTLMRFALRDAA